MGASEKSDDQVTPVLTGNGEKGYRVASSANGSVEYLIDPAEERAVLRKIDFIILPAMTFVYFFQCTRALPSLSSFINLPASCFVSLQENSDVSSRETSYDPND